MRLPNLPADFEGKYTKSRIEQLASEDFYSSSSAPEIGMIMFEIGKYFNQKYPGLEIFEPQIEDEVKNFFPNSTPDELTNQINFLRNSIRVFRMGESVYKEYVQKKLFPKAYRQVHSSKDYDSDDEVEYIEPQEGEFVKVYNFKKFLTYSENIDERAAIQKYKRSVSKNASFIDKIDYTLQKLELKKLFLYGVKYKNPLLSDLGTSQMSYSNHASGRLISPHTYIKNQKNILVGVQLVNETNKFILANNLSPTLKKPELDLSASQNVESYKILYPIPLYTNSYYFAHKYFGNFLLPVEITVSDVSKPLILNGSLKFNTCGANFSCSAEYLPLNLTIDADGEDFFSNGYSNFFNQNMQNIPAKTSDKISLEKFVVDKTNNKQSLRLEFVLKEKVSSFKIFLEEKDGYTRFEAPLISIQDNKIYAKISPLPDDSSNNLIDSQFIITATLNGKDSIRTTQIASESSIFDSHHQSLSLAIIFFAFLGGLILNFMPCIFPVLSLKIITLSQANIHKAKKLKQSLALTIGGIFCGFSILIVGLLFAKYLGYSLGWGMQFQNISFLIIMTFVLACFIPILPRINFDELYKKTVNTPNTKINFLIGGLIVLLSTPCTGPYLATAIGFALSGTYTDIVVILYSVALGLSFPYILCLIIKHPETLIPAPGKWLSNLDILMHIMLYITIMWFMVLIYNQTDIKCVVQLFISIIIFVGLFNLYRKFQDFLGGVFDESISLQNIKFARNISTIIIILTFGGLAYWCSATAQKSYLQNYEKNLVNRSVHIDIPLIQQKLNSGKSVLLEIRADWCLTCHFNQALVLNSINLEKWKAQYNLEKITVDWTNYNQDVLEFMEKYGRKGLPFYILYSPILREGIVLPEIFSTEDINKLLEGSIQK